MTSKDVPIPRTQPPHPPDFKTEAVRLAKRGDRSVRQTAKELGVDYNTLRGWLKQTDLDAGERHDRLTTAGLQELRELRRENGRPREEKEILIQAAAFFAQETDSRRPRRTS